MTRWQRYGHMGAVYPPLLKWCRELMAWEELAATSTARDAQGVFWEDTDAFDKWIATGYSLMLTAQFNMDAAHELLHFSNTGSIVLADIQEVLYRRGLYYYQPSDDDGYDDIGDNHSLSETWDMTVGAAMVRAKQEFQEDCPLHREWLTCGLCLFWQETKADPHEDEGHCIRLVDDSHVQWLQRQSQDKAWVQETVALYVLDNSDAPLWDWCFTERLGQAPSLQFIDSLLVLLDDNLESRQIAMALFSRNAPRLYQRIADAMQLHSNLFHEDDTRTQVVHAMLHTSVENTHGMDLDNAFCGTLFLDSP